MFDEPEKKGRMRHPLRNEFDQIREALIAQGVKPGPAGVQARALLAIAPAFLDFLEAERDAATPPPHLFEGMRAAIGNLALHTVKLTTRDGSHRNGLLQLLAMIEQDVAPRLGDRVTHGKLILPN